MLFYLYLFLKELRSNRLSSVQFRCKKKKEIFYRQQCEVFCLEPNKTLLAKGSETFSYSNKFQYSNKGMNNKGLYVKSIRFRHEATM